MFLFLFYFIYSFIFFFDFLFYLFIYLFFMMSDGSYLCQFSQILSVHLQEACNNWGAFFQNSLSPHFGQIDPFRIRRATSVPLGKGTKFALHHGKMSTTKHRAIQILHISTFQFTFKCGYNHFIPKYTDINSLHVTQIDLLYNDTFWST